MIPLSWAGFAVSRWQKVVTDLVERPFTDKYEYMRWLGQG